MRVAALETDSSFWPEGESAEPSGPWKPWVVRATEISRPRRAHGPARRGHARLRRRGGRRRSGRQREARRARAGGTRESGHRKVRNRGATFDAVARTEPARPLSSPRMGTASRSTAAPATMPQSLRAAPTAARGGDRRRGRRPAPARLRAVVPQLRRALRARVGARHRDGADAGLHGPLRPDPAPARDRWSRSSRCRSARAATRSWSGSSCSASACSCGSPTGSAPSCSRPGRRRGGARGADAPGARARRAARLPGHPVRRPDRVGGAARGAPAPPRRARARPARGGRADAPGGVGARRPLRALRLARRLDARARRLRRADRARAGAVGAHGLARDRRRAALAARDRRAGRDRRPPPRPAHGPVLDRASTSATRCASRSWSGSRSGSCSPTGSACAARCCRWRSPPRCSRCSSPARCSGCR